MLTKTANTNLTKQWSKARSIRQLSWNPSVPNEPSKEPPLSSLQEIAQEDGSSQAQRTPNQTSPRREILIQASASLLQHRTEMLSFPICGPLLWQTAQTPNADADSQASNPEFSSDPDLPSNQALNQGQPLSSAWTARSGLISPFYTSTAMTHDHG